MTVSVLVLCTSKSEACTVLHTHVELSDETGYIAVLEVIWKNILGKATLFKDVEAGTTLETQDTHKLITRLHYKLQPLFCAFWQLM